MKPCFIGFDCGTMGTKTVIYDVDGQCLAEAFRETQFEYPHPGWVQMDPNRYLESIIMGIQEVLLKSGVPGKAVKGISASGIVDGTVPVDQDFNPVGPFIPYLDLRAKEEAEWVSKNCEPIWEYESGKIGVGPDCVPMVMRWIISHKQPAATQAKKFVNIAPFVIGKLGGFKADDAYIDWSMASGWLIGFDLEKNNWSKRQFDLYGISEKWLPKVVAPWDVVGHVCPAMADQTGLTTDCALVAGAGDLMASSLGGGVVGEGQAFDVAGTASIMTFVTTDYDAARKNDVLVTAKSVFKEKLMLWGCLSSGGFQNGWYRDGIMNLKGISPAYAMMDALADKIPAGAEGLLWAPYLAGTMTPSWPQSKGTCMGLTPSHNQAHIWRAMMESVAFEYKMFLESLEKQGVTYKRVIGVGGGAKSKVWNQIKANIMNQPYTLISTQDTGALGNCAIAAYGTGHITDMVKAIEGWTTEKATFKPQPEQVAFYNKLYEQRQKIFKGPLSEIFDMWSEITDLTPPQA